MKAAAGPGNVSGRIPARLTAADLTGSKASSFADIPVFPAIDEAPQSTDVCAGSRVHAGRVNPKFAFRPHFPGSASGSPPPAIVPKVRGSFSFVAGLRP